MIGDKTFFDGSRTGFVGDKTKFNIAVSDAFGKFSAVVVIADNAEKLTFGIERCKVLCNIARTACTIILFENADDGDGSFGRQTVGNAVSENIQHHIAEYGNGEFIEAVEDFFHGSSPVPLTR